MRAKVDVSDIENVYEAIGIVAGHLDQLKERVAELERRQSAMEDYLGVEWYDVPGRERYVEKDNYD